MPETRSKSKDKSSKAIKSNDEQEPPSTRNKSRSDKDKEKSAGAPKTSKGQEDQPKTTQTEKIPVRTSASLKSDEANDTPGINAKPLIKITAGRAEATISELNEHLMPLVTTKAPVSQTESSHASVSTTPVITAYATEPTTNARPTYTSTTAEAAASSVETMYQRVSVIVPVPIKSSTFLPNMPQMTASLPPFVDDEPSYLSSTKIPSGNRPAVSTVTSNITVGTMTISTSYPEVSSPIFVSSRHPRMAVIVPHDQQLRSPSMNTSDSPSEVNSLERDQNTPPKTDCNQESSSSPGSLPSPQYTNMHCYRYKIY